MTSWHPQIEKGEEPLYVTIATALYRDIQEGRCTPAAGA